MKNIFSVKGKSISEQFDILNSILKESGTHIIGWYCDIFSLSDVYTDDLIDKSNIYREQDKLRFDWIANNKSKIKKYISNLSKKIGLTELETIMISVLYLIAGDEGESTSDCGICNFFNLERDKQITKVLKSLDKQGFIEYNGSRYISMTETTRKCIKNDSVPFEPEIYTKYKLIKKATMYIKNNWSYISFAIDEESRVDDKNFIIKLKDFTTSDRMLVYFLLYTSLKCSDDVSFIETISNVYCIKEEVDAIRFADKFISGENDLVKNGIIEVTRGKDEFDIDVELSEDTYRAFFGDDYEYYTKVRRIKESKEEYVSPDIIKSEKIVEKKLYYNEENQKQIDFLYNSMDEEKLSALKERLEKNNLPTGICVMLYGAPGTGKTETVLQIAKMTNRDILHVDISQSKSCWFGESEKKIKKIFTRYKSMCKYAKENHKNIPILLFNEADAIFSKRQNVDASSVAQTENAMQNIILEEMESIEGILIATTNLVNNFDPAFERRFLFKVKFDKPSLESKTLIWKDKINYLADDEYKKIASEFDFSGGEIDNVARKAIMHEVLNGELPKFNEILDMCRTEKLSSSKCAAVGFRKAC